MAKKGKNSGLGRGLDSLIPKIEEQEVEEGISLEDILNQKKDEEELTFEEEPADEDKELVFTEEELNTDDGILVEEEDVEKYEEEIVEEEVDDELLNQDESSEYTNVFFNDDEKIGKDERYLEKFEEELEADEGIENIDSSINLNDKTEKDAKIIEASNDINESLSLLSEKEEKLIDEVIETVENNPRITLWSARSAAVLRFLRKTEPEFSISNEASNLIDAAIAEKYPEIWTLFNHL